MVGFGKIAPFETPRALETAEIEKLIDQYRHAARNAMLAGFDGVEIHGANGYLIEQFLQSRSNQRVDKYGGTIDNRARFLREVTEAVAGVCGSDRTGVRLSPFGSANDSGEDDPVPLYSHVVRSLATLDLAYLHFIEPRSSISMRTDVARTDVPMAIDLFRPLWPGVLMSAGGFTAESATEAIGNGKTDLIAFGRSFISNPDLPQRLKAGVALNRPDRATFYGGDATGYTDYAVHG
jgi:N-ethylmaleimide reductase